MPIRQVVVPEDSCALAGLDTQVPLVTVPPSVTEVNIILNQTLWVAEWWVFKPPELYGQEPKARQPKWLKGNQSDVPRE